MYIKTVLRDLQNRDYKINLMQNLIYPVYIKINFKDEKPDHGDYRSDIKVTVYK